MTKVYTTTKRRPDGAAFIVAVGLAALGALLIWQGAIIPDKGGYAGIGSGDTPMFVGWALVALGLAHLVKAVQGRGTAVPRQQVVPIAFIVGGLLLQLVLLKPLGFSIASGILFAMTAAAFGKRNLALTLPVGIVFAFLVYGIFDRVLQLNLPGGFLEHLIYGG
ncbi:MAG: tripartite tricarboxylate transporter TctB family protein [Cypionkella sp.]|uniref:tripartite tricarboxylate transporter TctB family protein n=1 Tax=Cypionkella sp. TaxID=2811411 RepID=UPI002AB83C48|nr:tripartite tricarboxylate transporter TctB family protein [Cypionkella sp.]MDZ4311551.1 tripartite tricarboxylate transporter TctB family protein [Cypionkella sp.]MDZ4393880.1 tripartite tricarboxylate transporter TctB family protein [Cypionkella sp.]